MKEQQRSLWTTAIISKLSLSKLSLTTMTTPALKLTYFDIAGRAGTARLALTITGIPFEDVRVLTPEEWAAMKQSVPYKLLPTLSVDGQVFAQSHAITRYVGTLSGFYPKNNPLVALLVDEICDFNEDILAALVLGFLEQDQNKRRAKREELATTKLPEMFAMLEARLASSKGDPWVLDSISLADLSIYGTVSMMKSGRLELIPTDICEKYAKMTAIYEAVAKLPAVAAWNDAHQCPPCFMT
ncbi:unnamed protein product [Aphanomyces euteiches]